jgi:hypothetical protein
MFQQPYFLRFVVVAVGFTTTYAICLSPLIYCEFESRSGRGIQHYVIKFVSDMWQVCDFLRLEVHRAAENLELSVIWLVGSKAGKLSLIDVCCLKFFNATFNNISAISWQSVLLVEETRGPGENHRPVTCVVFKYICILTGTIYTTTNLRKYGCWNITVIIIRICYILTWHSCLFYFFP